MSQIKFFIDIQDKDLSQAVKEAVLQAQVFEMAGNILDASLIFNTEEKTDLNTYPAVFSISGEKRLRFGSSLKKIAQILGNRPRPFDFGDFTFDPETKKLTDRGKSQDFVMTDLETSLLLYIYDADEGGFVSKEDLLKDVWNYSEGVTTHTVETHIYRLRQKVPGLDQHLLTTEDGYVLK